MKVVLFIVSVVALLQQEVSANSGGAPAGACDTLAPNPATNGGHGADPQTSNVPYSIDLSPFSSNDTYSYYPGQSYTRKYQSPVIIILY